ncbi:hypothetical protein Pan44_14720 [Caulifigura coniformis]|uniref:TadE-like protein n=1 Tax=Caulifigura coniformis TaxID=2527983 RepID=A0A517SBF6_9PLAN|nr:hypothetical protein [Caulifigura coniformis]QDT53455.1 hypothetical protein Pan44_14720 [Caulifigura coniformis]
MSAKLPFSRRTRNGALWIELVLLAPVAGLLLLGVVEVRHALNIEARLASAADRVAGAGESRAEVIASERAAISAALQVPVAEIRVDTSIGSPRSRVTICVPYARTGSLLASFWPKAIAAGTSHRTL